MDVDDVDEALPPFHPPHRRDWHYVAYVVGWIVSLPQAPNLDLTFQETIRCKLPFLFELPTLLEQRNEATRRILRVLVDTSKPLPSVENQTGEYWIDSLTHERASTDVTSDAIDKDQEFWDLCRQFGQVGIHS